MWRKARVGGGKSESDKSTLEEKESTKICNGLFFIYLIFVI